MKGFISVKDYADKEQISVQAVYQRIAKNTVTYEKVGKVFLIKEK